MSMPGVKKKMVDALTGRTFISRGGNGQPTKQQLMLHIATGLPMEHAIPTAPVKTQFAWVPHCYKVDLAVPEEHLAIEVDGKSHRLKKWRFLDHRKTEILNALGWSVLRFTNEEVNNGLMRCVAMIESTILKSRQITTIS